MKLSVPAKAALAAVVVLLGTGSVVMAVGGPDDASRPSAGSSRLSADAGGDLATPRPADDSDRPATRKSSERSGTTTSGSDGTQAGARPWSPARSSGARSTGSGSGAGGSSSEGPAPTTAPSRPVPADPDPAPSASPDPVPSDSATTEPDPEPSPTPAPDLVGGLLSGLLAD